MLKRWNSSKQPGSWPGPGELHARLGCFKQLPVHAHVFLCSRRFAVAARELVGSARENAQRVHGATGPARAAADAESGTQESSNKPVSAHVQWHLVSPLRASAGEVEGGNAWEDETEWPSTSTAHTYGSALPQLTDEDCNAVVKNFLLPRFVVSTARQGESRHGSPKLKRDSHIVASSYM